MKYIILLTGVLLCSLALNAQKKASYVKLQLLTNEKVAGKMVKVTDSSITLTANNSNTKTIAVSEILSIRFKRSFTQNAFIIGSITGATVGLTALIASAARKPSDNPLEDALGELIPTPMASFGGGLFSGLGAGIAFAGIQAAARGKMKYIISADTAKWKELMPLLNKYCSPQN